MNQTDVRTFKASSMQEALEIVRREMGPEAVILHTREIPAPRFLKWRKTNERVEVTAGTGVNVRTPRALLRQPAAGRSAATASTPAGKPHDELLAPPPSFPAPVAGLARSRLQSPEKRGVTSSPTEPLRARPGASAALAPGSTWGSL